MANFALAGTIATTSASFQTMVSVTAATASLHRGKMYDLLLGTSGTPADNAMTFDVSRQTTLGTGTAKVPAPLDPADTASATVGTVNYTIEPTITAATNLLNVGVNQRASYRWVAAPGSEFVWPATNVNGLAVRVLSGGYTGTSTASTLFQEQ